MADATIGLGLFTNARNLNAQIETLLFRSREIPASDQKRAILRRIEALIADLQKAYDSGDVETAVMRGIELGQAFHEMSTLVLAERENHRRDGHKRKYRKSELVPQALALYQRLRSVRAVAEKMGRSERTIRRYLREAGVVSSQRRNRSS